MIWFCQSCGGQHPIGVVIGIGCRPGWGSRVNRLTGIVGVAGVTSWAVMDRGRYKIVIAVGGSPQTIHHRQPVAGSIVGISHAVPSS